LRTRGRKISSGNLFRSQPCNKQVVKKRQSNKGYERISKKETPATRSGTRLLNKPEGKRLNDWLGGGYGHHAGSSDKTGRRKRLLRKRIKKGGT